MPRGATALVAAALLALPGAASASRPPNTAIGGGYATVTVGPATATGATAHLPLTCSGTPGANCFVLVSMSVRETLRGNRVIAISASKRHKQRKHTRLDGVGGTTVSLGVGKTFTVPLPLYANGKRLLAHHHPLPVGITVQSGHFKLIARTTVTFTK